MLRFWISCLHPNKMDMENIWGATCLSINKVLVSLENSDWCFSDLLLLIIKAMTAHYRWVVNDLWTFSPFDWRVQGSMEPRPLNQEVNGFLLLLFFCFWGTMKIGQISPIMDKKPDCFAHILEKTRTCHVLFFPHSYLGRDHFWALVLPPAHGLCFGSSNSV